MAERPEDDEKKHEAPIAEHTSNQRHEMDYVHEDDEDDDADIHAQLGADHHDDDTMDWLLEDLPDGVKEYAEKFKEFALKKVEENPMQALAMAAGAGALIAVALGGTRGGRKGIRKIVKALPKSIRKPLRKAVNV
ncbi:MAG TPA: hypothetical protein VEK08_24045 [Planctomycetota bacterium]|nr:hypothetical protein [Planctomycetota bacterium]